jgi:hypothetical protein
MLNRRAFEAKSGGGQLPYLLNHVVVHNALAVIVRIDRVMGRGAGWIVARPSAPYIVAQAAQLTDKCVTTMPNTDAQTTQTMQTGSMRIDHFLLSRQSKTGNTQARLQCPAKRTVVNLKRIPARSDRAASWPGF